ncbi:MAG: hypothetical protein JWO90_1629, partial [Solirubrobacterales bacterium]|nr:hypothetical protein [Solirubrobacterales bacterium]
ALTHLRRVLAEGVSTDGQAAGGLGDGLRRADMLARGHGLVVVVSDFLEGPEAWEGPLGALRHRHDVIAVEVRDRRDEELPAVGVLWLRDPETGRDLQVDTNSAGLRGRFAAAAAQRQAATAQALKRRGVRHAVCRTDGDWIGSLGAVLR